MATLQSTNVQGTLCVNGVAVGGGKDFKYCCITASTTWTPSQDLVDGNAIVDAVLVGGGGGSGGVGVCMTGQYTQTRGTVSGGGGGGVVGRTTIDITSTDACNVTIGAGGVGACYSRANFTVLCTAPEAGGCTTFGSGSECIITGGGGTGASFRVCCHFQSGQNLALVNGNTGTGGGLIAQPGGGAWGGTEYECLYAYCGENSSCSSKNAYCWAGTQCCWDNSTQYSCNPYTKSFHNSYPTWCIPYNATCCERCSTISTHPWKHGNPGCEPFADGERYGGSLGNRVNGTYGTNLGNNSYLLGYSTAGAFCFQSDDVYTASGHLDEECKGFGAPPTCGCLRMNPYTFGMAGCASFQGTKGTDGVVVLKWLE
jgi:hypothetical protein